MPIPVNAPYKKRQRAGREAVRNRGTVLWVSNQILTHMVGGIPIGPWMKRQVQGTRVGSFTVKECRG